MPKPEPDTRAAAAALHKAGYTVQQYQHKFWVRDPWGDDPDVLVEIGDFAREVHAMPGRFMRVAGALRPALRVVGGTEHGA